MSERLAVFLRGINVGGVQVPMAALKETFVAVGFTGVQTVLATGNVVVAPPAGADPAALKTALEAALSGRFQYQAYVLLRDQRAVADVVAAARALDTPPDAHCYILLSDDPSLPGELAALFTSLPQTPGEQFLPAGGEALWVVPKGATLQSEFGNKALGSKRFKPRLTSRNLNTMEKVLKLLV